MAAQLADVLHLGDEAGGATAVTRYGRHREKSPGRFAIVPAKAFFDGVPLDLAGEQSGCDLGGLAVVLLREVPQASRGEILGGRAEHAAERAIDPEDLSVRR